MTADDHRLGESDVLALSMLGLKVPGQVVPELLCREIPTGAPIWEVEESAGDAAAIAARSARGAPPGSRHTG